MNPTGGPRDLSKVRLMVKIRIRTRIRKYKGFFIDRKEVPYVTVYVVNTPDYGP